MHNELLKECPACPRVGTRQGERGVELEVVRDNYSGCGVDICRCPKCGKYFQVSYKIDEITEVK